MIYKNKYGTLEIQAVGPYKNVSELHSKDFNEECFFTINEAEKIALITGNNGIQLGIDMWDRKKAFVFHHKSYDIAAVCKIVSLEFNENINARKVLARPSSWVRPNWYEE